MSGRYSDNAPSENDEETYNDGDNTYTDGDNSDNDGDNSDNDGDNTDNNGDTEQGQDEEEDYDQTREGEEEIQDQDDTDEDEEVGEENEEEEVEEDDEEEVEDDYDDDDSEGVEDDQYYDEEAYREDEYTEKEDEDDGRARCLYVTICCCCIILIIIAIIIGIVLSRKKKIAPAPTMAPTVFGGGFGPTLNPTKNLVPPFAEGAPNGDTTVYKEGPLQSQPQGEEEVMVIQNGNNEDPNFPDTYGLMNWYWDDVGYPWFNEDDLADYDVDASLCMEHIPNTNQGSEVGTVYSLCRLPSSFPGDQLETSTSTGYNYVMPTDCMGQKKLDFMVQPDDVNVCVKVTPLINVHPPFAPTETSPNMRRGLQENNYQNMLFMLDNIVVDKRATGEFYTRQAGDRSPILRLTMKPKSSSDGSGSGSGSGTGSDNGTGSGSGGVNGGTEAPTFPNGSGSDSGFPPSIGSTPTISPAPTITPSPTGNQTFTPCGVCGEGPAGTLLRDDYEVTIPDEIAPASIKGQPVTCAKIEEICLAGECNQQVCSGLAETRQACGCPGAGGPTLCGICPAQTQMTNLDEDLSAILAQYVDQSLLVAAAGDDGEVTCSDLDSFCKGGQCGAEVCLSIPEIVREPCGCETVSSSVPFPPFNNAPTEAPTASQSPTISAAPTYKAEFGVCGICGVGPTPNPLKPDVPIRIPDHLAPPQVKNGTASCAELEEYCQGGYCRPLTCRVLRPIRGLCGCPNADPSCSICGPGKVVSNTGATLTLDSTIALPGYDPSMTCGQLNSLCAEGYCNADSCGRFPEVVMSTCGCIDTLPDFTLFSSGDTTIYGAGPLKEDSQGGKDTMLVQAGVSDNEELPPAFALLEFTVTDTDYQQVVRLGFATIELCLHHVINVEADREAKYRVCLVPNVAGGIESATGGTVDYSIPGTCSGGKVAEFTVQPSSQRVCITVSDMFRNDVKSPTTVTFMVAAGESSDQPGDSFYTKQDASGRVPTIQFVDRPYGEY
ncbi:hypothetical protein IV203_013853 [Nitzschia inconspicua]|uniref:Uncharacterized protein n=1 Tax=Nitzschia inconspicua TaxID=303405 RepID=A0A9K3K6F5_9STRA|nr:hypothetical protein IV203_014188 [Nitzschia inconspicua]KAG7374758.1 hypothetical protein IV203_013853 [Nitzschia inconspicua]